MNVHNVSQKIIHIVIMITDLKKKTIFWVKNDFGLFFEILTFFGRKIDLFWPKKRFNGNYKKREMMVIEM